MLAETTKYTVHVLQWPSIFKISHGTLKMWSYNMADGLKVNVR